MKSKCDYIANGISKKCSCSQDTGNNELKFRGISESELQKALNQAKGIREHNQAIMTNECHAKPAVNPKPTMIPGGVFILYASRNGYKNKSVVKAISPSGFPEFVKDTKSYIDCIMQTYSKSKIDFLPITDVPPKIETSKDDFMDVVIDDTAHFILSVNVIEDVQDLSDTRGPLKVKSLKEYSEKYFYSFFYKIMLYCWSIKNQKLQDKGPNCKNEKMDKVVESIDSVIKCLQELKQSLNS